MFVGQNQDCKYLAGDSTKFFGQHFPNPATIFFASTSQTQAAMEPFVFCQRPPTT